MTWVDIIINWLKSLLKEVDKPPIPEPTPPDEIKAKLLQLINKERTNRNIPILLVDDKLNNAAQKHTDYMIKNNKLTHNQPGNELAKRISAEGYNWRAIAENIAQGYPTPETVVKGWMQSQGHRDNILNPRYKDVGFGYGKDDNNYWWWTTVFAAKN